MTLFFRSTDEENLSAGCSGTQIRMHASKYTYSWFLGLDCRSQMKSGACFKKKTKCTGTTVHDDESKLYSDGSTSPKTSVKKGS